MKVQLLYNTECTFYTATLKMLRTMGIEPELILIDSDEKAQAWLFFGSPQVMIDGKDIDPNAQTVTNFHASGCRLYVFEGKVYDYPPAEMLKKVLGRNIS